MAESRPMYELMYVINPVLSDDQTKNMVDRVQNYLRENDADVVHTEEMGSQRLAYPIQKKRNGYYVVTNFRGDGTFIAKLERALQINDDILRHLVLRYDAKMQRYFEQQRAKAAEQPVEADA
ncbi:MAG: 30S ribosomal protein S6 [Bacteroidota bacterium]